MSDTTNIEWCDSTFNPWIGCTKVSIEAQGGGGCDHCYAHTETPVRVLRGQGHETFGPGASRQRTSVDYWKQPLRWNAQAVEFKAQHGRQRRVFCASLADVFDNEVDPAWRADLFALIAATPALDWLLLTKRVGNVKNMVEPFGGFRRGIPSNVWLGATVVNQAEADRDIPKLLAVPAMVRFLSIEPMLGPIDLGRAFWECCGNYGVGAEYMGSSEQVCCGCPDRRESLHWVIAGGESGNAARPSNPQWFRDLRDQCLSAEVPFLFKQWGEFVSVSEVAGSGAHHTFDDGRTVRRVGKKLAGRLLDGMQHDGYPEALA